MADTSYAIMYRPSMLDEYVGDDISTNVRGIMAVKPEQRPHMWLVTGPAGTGKTTLSEILAKWYQCQSPVNGEPCECCEMCKEINENLIFAENGSECWGVIEVDTASDSGKKDIDSIIDNVTQKPQGLKHMVVIWDECHMLTEQAQNRLLKICEKPPEHLIMIFGTTNPEKMLGTLYDRLTFKIQTHKADEKQMRGRLIKCCEGEKITYSNKALSVIIRNSGRNPRRSFNSLELIAKSHGMKCDLEAVEKFFAKDTEMFEQFFACSQKGLGELMFFVEDLKQKDVNLKDFVKGIPKYILDCINVRHGIALDGYTPEFVKKASALFKEYKESEFDTLLQVVEFAIRELGQGFNSDELIETVIVTTGMRVSKLGLLAKGLQDEEQLSYIENRKGSAEAIAIQQQEYEASRPIPTTKTVSGDLLLASLGGTVTEIVTTSKKPVIVEEDSDEDDEDYESEEDFDIGVFAEYAKDLLPKS